MAEIVENIDLKEILKPISKDAPTGSDPEMNPEYINLDAELNKMSGLDYALVTDLALKILTKESKHLRVAVWLCLGWLQIRGMEGFRDGLKIVLELLEQYGETLFPEKPKMQRLALQALGTEKRLSALIGKIEVNDTNARAVKESQGILGKIIQKASDQFSDSPPKFDHLRERLQEKSDVADELVPGQEEEKGTNSMDGEEGEESEEVHSADSAIDSEGMEDETGTETAGDGETTTNSDDSSPESTDQEKKEEEKIPLPNTVADLLEPISDKTPTGEDIEKTEDQDVMVEFMTLESEMGKFSGNDYEKCAQDCQRLLLERTKHLRIAIWLMISWFRFTGLAGIRDGLALVYYLLTRFPEELHPRDKTLRANTLQLLNSDARIKLIEKTDPDESNAPTFIDIHRIFSAILAVCDDQFKDKSPRFGEIRGILDEKGQEAKALLEQKENRSKKTPQQRSKPETSRERGRDGAARSSGSATPSLTTGEAVSPRELEINRDQDAQLAMKKVLEYYFEEETGGGKTRKVPEKASIYGMSRVYRWGDLGGLPPAKDNVTQIEAPNQPKQNYIRKLVSNKDWDTLIPEIEANFLSRADFLYWIDAQRFVVKALEAKGEPLAQAAEEIKYHLAHLLKRLPGLTKLVFKDKDTPFADKETVQWIEDEIQTAFGNGQVKEKILPPIMGEEYESINTMYEEACEALPADFEKNLKMMQDSVSGDTRPKGRFLRLLSCANFCYVARQYAIARVLFHELHQKIEQYHIIEWEQALCVAVWQSTYLNNTKLLKTELPDDDRRPIQQEQRQLFDHISKYDSILALSLMNKEKGE